MLTATDRELTMKNLISLLLKGLAAVLPLALTLYVVYWLGKTLESIAQAILLWFIPESVYFTGLGLISALLALIAVGLLVNAYLVRHLIDWSDTVMTKIPVIKSVYGAIKDAMKVFTLTENKAMGAVVSVDIGQDMKLIGFITGEKTGKKLFADADPSLVGVYLPMSYQIGGFTVYLPRERLTTLDISIEEAMRLAITGGLQQQDQARPLSKTPTT
jgi:uncharacterized membrane protein